MDPEQSAPAAESKSAKYHRAHRVLTLASYAVEIAALVLLILTGSSAAIRSLAEQMSARPVLSLPVYLIAIGASLKLVSFPFDYLGGFWLEHRYDLSNLSIHGWLWDEMKSLLVGGALAILALELVYGSLRAWPRHWWIVDGAVFTMFFVLMANLAPVLIVPLFYKLKPLESPSLEARLRRLAESAGTHIQGVYEWKLGEKTKKANAALMGLGNTRRILLADTLLQGFNEDEIEAVLAHELGHHVHADIWRGLAANTAAAFVGLYAVSLALTHWSVPLGFRGATDFANLPLVILVTLIVSMLLLPAVNSFSRSLERAADAYAVRSIPDASVFISGLERLASLNLAERQPHPWIEFLFHSHPSIESRISFIRGRASLQFK